MQLCLCIGCQTLTKPSALTCLTKELVTIQRGVLQDECLWRIILIIIINSPLCLSQNSVISWNSILWFKLIAFCFCLLHFFEWLCVPDWPGTYFVHWAGLELRDSLSASWSAKLIVLFTFLFFICLSLYVCVCAVVEQFQLYILEFASNASLSFFFHYGIVLNSWFSNLRFVCAGIAGVHHHTMLYFWWYFFLFLSGDMFLLPPHINFDRINI